MKFRTSLLAASVASSFLIGCGGGSTNPYDGTWSAVYPNASIASTYTPTKIVECTTPPAVLVIKNAAGTTTQSSTCKTTLITPAIPAVLDAAGNIVTPAVPEVRTAYPVQAIYYNIGVNIEKSSVSGQKDVLRAIVNGAAFTGECISTIACSATSGADTLSLTR